MLHKWNRFLTAKLVDLNLCYFVGVRKNKR